LLLIYVPNLKPNVSIGKRARRVAQDTIEAPAAFVVFRLLLVDDPQPEEDFVGHHNFELSCFESKEISPLTKDL
jgi:hypothetical protein